jgi:hypothetical protein
MIEFPILSSFAADFLAFVEKQTGVTEKLAIEVFLCDEKDWATLAINLGLSKTRQRVNDSFMWTFALIRNQFGQFKRSTESERLEKLVQAGFQIQAANIMSRYDTYVLLRNALLKTPAKLLHQTAYQTIQALNMVQNPAAGPNYGRGSHILNHAQLYNDFQGEVGTNEFNMRYIEPATKF